MKKNLITLLFIFLIAGLKAFSADQFTIKVLLKGDAEGKKVWLKTVDQPVKSLDSTFVKNNSIEFKGTIPYPQLCMIVIDIPSKINDRYNAAIPIFLENSAITVNAELDERGTELELLITNNYPYQKVNVTGSASHDLYMSYINGRKPLTVNALIAFYTYADLIKQKVVLSKRFPIIEKLDTANAKLGEWVKQFIKNNSESPVALLAAKNDIARFSASEIEDIINELSPALKSSLGGVNFLNFVNTVKKTANGAKFVDLNFQDVDGKTVKLSDHLGKGKYVLIDFWASWCNPCREDIPHLKEVYELYHQSGFDVISVSIDAKKDNWLKAVGEEKMNWLQLVDLKANREGGLLKTYNIIGVPTCILFSPDGTIITRNMRGSWMDKKLIDLFGNKFVTNFQ